MHDQHGHMHSIETQETGYQVIYFETLGPIVSPR